MKYVKLTQSQLNEIQELLESKNNTIKSLKDKINGLEKENIHKLKEDIYFLKEDNRLMSLECENTKSALNDAERNYKSIYNDYKTLEDENHKVKCELSIQKSVTKAAIKMLNELGYENIPTADLSNILDIKG